MAPCRRVWLPCCDNNRQHNVGLSGISCICKHNCVMSLHLCRTLAPTCVPLVVQEFKGAPFRMSKGFD